MSTATIKTKTPIKYRHIRKIGQGGFGEVWECERMNDGARVAQKKALTNLDDDGLKRFAREVRILSKLDHPNIVKIIGRRLLTPPFWYIMPLYDHSLETIVPELVGEPERIAPIFSSVLDAVEYAHSEGVLHRDLNPRNVLMNGDTDLVISDFGLGRFVDSESTRQTQTGFHMGTVLYMPPEQLNDAKTADERADVYSLGRLLYELHTGPLVSLHQDVRQLPAGIAHIVSRCTQHDPWDRFQSITELKRAWGALIDVHTRVSVKEELRGLTADIAATGSLDETIAVRFAELLEQNHDDSDLIHDLVMKLPASGVAAIWRVRKCGVGLVLKSWLSFINSQSWPFSYTDTIADHVHEMYSSIDDGPLRANMVVSLLKLARAHNRFHVYDVFSELMYHGRSAAELAELACECGKLSPGLKEDATDKLEASKVDPEIWQILEAPEDEIPF